jgi:hypothetical protein
MSFKSFKGADMITKRFSSQELYNLRNLIPIHILIEKILMIPSKISEGFFRFLCPLCSEFNTATNPETNLARCFRCEKNFNTIDMVMITRKASFVESVNFLKKCRNGFADKKNDCQVQNACLPNADLPIISTPPKPQNNPFVISREPEAPHSAGQKRQAKTYVPTVTPVGFLTPGHRKIADKGRCFPERNTSSPYYDGRKEPVAIGRILHTLGFNVSDLGTGELRALPDPQPCGAGAKNEQIHEAPSSEIDGLKACQHKSIIQRVVQLEHNFEHLSRKLEQVRAIIGVIDNLGHLGTFPR